MSATLQLEIQAGPHPRHMVPVAVAAPPAVAPGTYRLLAPGDELAAEVRDGVLICILTRLAAGEVRTYRLQPASLPAQIRVNPAANRLEIALPSGPLATMHLMPPRPFLHPVHAPGGRSVVRGWPVDPQPRDRTDHEHHRGLWVAHGDVNGTDTWTDAGRNGGPGRMRLQGFGHAAGPACADVWVELLWTTADGAAVASERRDHRFWAVDGDVRYIDIASRFTGADGQKLRFGDTKEGGLVAVRVAAGLEGDRGGTIRTAAGALGEREAWGGSAAWCDDSGLPVGGDETIGIAICDHPHNPLSPTRWHVRDYGLMAANPFALAAYMPDRGVRGDWEVPAGKAATFRHRVIPHRGDALQADIPARYVDWAFPPSTRWLPA